MHAYSLELVVHGELHAAKLFRAIKQFDPTIVMGTALVHFRKHEPFLIELDNPQRAEILRRLVDLLDEIELLGVAYEITANNVPRSSQFWAPERVKRADIESAMVNSRHSAIDPARGTEILNDHIAPSPPPSRTLFESRWRQMDFATLLVEEQHYIHLWTMHAEVNNGGFATFFFNSSGDTANEALVALEKIGSMETEELLDEAIALFDEVGGYSADRETRIERLNQLADDCFTESNMRYYDSGEDVVSAAFAQVELAYKHRSLL